MSDTTQTTRPGGHKPQTQLRGVQSHQTTADRLGALRNLPGFWEGTGFSLIARPDFSGRSPNGFFLQLNLLRETIEFTTIGSPVLNRGSAQDDIAIYGVTYLHRVTDGETGGALHVEPGMWLNIPATTAPKADASINSESPAWAIDRLSILALKIFHMEEEAHREDASEEHRQKCQQKLEVLLEQRTDLSTAIDQLLADIEQGNKYMKVYKQMKMYNDDELNPVLRGTK